MYLNSIKGLADKLDFISDECVYRITGNQDFSAEEFGYELKKLISLEHSFTQFKENLGITMSWGKFVGLLNARAEDTADNYPEIAEMYRELVVLCDSISHIVIVNCQKFDYKKYVSSTLDDTSVK